jgi:putative inorganic carbon (hco3(-)) transporter
MFELAAILAAQCALLIAVIILREPKLLIPAVIIGLPFEVLETEALDILGDSGLTGAIRSLLNPGQAAMVATVVVGVVRLRHEPARLIPNSALLLPFGALFALEFIGVAWSDSIIPPNKVLILPLYAAFIIVAPSLIENRRDVERILGAFLAIAIFLSVVAIAQRLLGVFNWRGILIQSDAYSYRSNATFADPNNFARFLALAMSLAAGLILATGPRRTTVYLAIPALLFGAVAIVASASRAGWLMLILCGFLVVMMAPIARYTKLRLTLAATVSLVAFLGFVLASGGTDAERVRSLADGFGALGQREFLIRAGVEMFKDNPLTGVGSGNYQNSIIVTYFHFVPYWARGTSLSHTSLVSIMAELGILGIAAFLLVSTKLAITLAASYWRTTVRFNRLVIGWLAAAFLGILFHSQSEGRLLEEPYLWVLIAIVIAFETGPAFTGRPPAPAPLEPAARVRPAPRSPARPVAPPRPAPEPVHTRPATGHDP